MMVAMVLMKKGEGVGAANPFAEMAVERGVKEVDLSTLGAAPHP
jgi:hypothetical protein